MKKIPPKQVTHKRPENSHKKPYNHQAKKAAEEHLKKVEDKAKETIEKEQEELEDVEFNALELLYARGSLIHKTLEEYVNYLDQQDEKHEFSDFNGCVECFYQYHDLIAVIENKLDYVETVEHDLVEQYKSLDQIEIAQFEQLIHEHFEAIMGITNQNMASISELLMKELNPEVDYQAEILKHSRAASDSIKNLSDTTLIVAAVEGREEAKKELSEEVQDKLEHEESVKEKLAQIRSQRPPKKSKLSAQTGAKSLIDMLKGTFMAETENQL